MQIKGEVRKDFTKSATNQLRRDGNVPCVIYGGETNVHFYAPQLTFRDLVYTSDFYKVELEVEGKKYECIMKDLQFDPVSDKLSHIDFQELIPDRKVTLDLPIRLKGLAKGVKAGGKLVAKMRKVRAKGLPKDLLSEVTLDVTNIEMGKSIKVGSIDAGNLEILNAASIPVASVEVPRAMRSQQTKDAKAAEKGKKTEGAETAESE